MQTTALVAAQGAADDELGGHDEVAQFNEVVADPEMRVEVIDLAVQQADAVLRPLQALGRADDADVVRPT